MIGDSKPKTVKFGNNDSDSDQPVILQADTLFN